MRSDIEIAQSTPLQPIARVAEKLGLGEESLEPYGRYMAKLRLPPEKPGQKRGKLILVTAINPTKAGEGKTTTSIGLADALNRLGKKAVLSLREPSLGPVFGMKGGATGGGYAQVAPMEDINLHFTGDFHAIGTANNLLAAMVDNHIYHGNELGIDRVVWRRCMDMNDRQLRSLETGVGGGINGVPRPEHFDITVASEVMAVFCLAEDLSDLKARLGRMIVGYTKAGKPVTAHDLKAEGAMAALLKQAVLPNLVQTLEGTPAIVHGAPSPTSPTAAAAYWPLGRRCAWGVLRHGGRLRRGPGRREIFGYQVPRIGPLAGRCGGSGHCPGPEASRRRRGQPFPGKFGCLEKGPAQFAAPYQDPAGDLFPAGGSGTEPI